MRSARPSFRYCLIRECLKQAFTLTWASRVITLVLHVSWVIGRPRPPGRYGEDEFHAVRAAQIEVVRDQRLHEPAGSPRRVEQDGARGFDLPQRQLSPVTGGRSASVNGSGSTSSHRSAQALDIGRPEPVTDRL